MASTVCLDLTPLMNCSRLRGIGMYCRELFTALCGLGPELRGLQLHVLVGGHGPFIRVRPAGGDPSALIAAAASGPIIRQNLYYLLKHTSACAALAHAPMDLYHSAEPRGTTRPRRGKILVTCHDFIPVRVHHRFDPPEAVKAAIERLRFRGLDHAIAISGQTRDDFLRITGLPEDRVTVVPHGVDTRRFSPTARDGEAEDIAKVLGDSRPYFLYVGGFDLRKQVPTLIRAFGRRLHDLEEILVLGGNASKKERRTVENALSEVPQARSRVRLPGYVPDALLPALYRNATAHVLASSFEGFGMTVTEAFACACPVIAVGQSSIPEVAGDAALLVPPGDPEALGEAMVRVAGDAQLRRTLAAAGLERSALFTWEHTARKTVEVYRRVLES